jgi:hypothetical protein
VDHRNPETAFPRDFRRGEPKGGNRAQRQGLRMIVTNFAGVRPWRGNRLREENGKGSSRAGSVRATSWSGHPGFGSMLR